MTRVTVPSWTLGLLAASAWADGGLRPVEKLRAARYDMRTGAVTPVNTGHKMRGLVPCWDSSGVPRYFTAFPPTQVLIDIGDGNSDCLDRVELFRIGYGTDLPGPIDIDVVLYASDNGGDPPSPTGPVRTPAALLRLTGLPGAPAGMSHGWQITVTPDAPIDLGAAQDLDGDGLGDFSYSYHMRNAPTSGPLGVGPLIAGDPNDPLATGIRPVFYRWSVDPNNAPGPDDFLLPRNALLPSNTVYDGTYWFGGGLYSQFPMQLLQAADGCGGCPNSACEAADIAPGPCGDCRVDISDLAALLGGFGITSGATREQGDIEGADGDVDLADLAAMLTDFGCTD